MQANVLSVNVNVTKKEAKHISKYFLRHENLRLVSSAMDSRAETAESPAH